MHDHKRVFISDEADDNLLECVVEKKKVIRIPVPVSTCGRCLRTFTNEFIACDSLWLRNLSIPSCHMSFSDPEVLDVLSLHLQSRFKTVKWIVPKCDYYYDMGYNAAYSTFYVLPEGKNSVATVSCSTAVFLYFVL